MIDFLSVLTPFMYFTGTGLVGNGISVLYILLAVVITVTAGYLTYYKYERRDLHS
jgi:ABC-2 type transport system permease protein